MRYDPLCATDMQDNYGMPASTGPVQRDDAFSDDRLNRAEVETVGKMDHQGIAPTSHNSGDLTVIGPVDRSENHNSEAVANGYGRIS